MLRQFSNADEMMTHYRALKVRTRALGQAAKPEPPHTFPTEPRKPPPPPWVPVLIPAPPLPIPPRHAPFPRNARETCLDVVAERREVSAADMLGNCRKRRIAFPRQLAMFVIREIGADARRVEKNMCSFTLPGIGRFFGDRDHTTVLHAVRKIGALCEGDPVFRAEVDGILAEVRARIARQREALRAEGAACSRSLP